MILCQFEILSNCSLKGKISHYENLHRLKVRFSTQDKANEPIISPSCNNNLQ